MLDGEPWKTAVMCCAVCDFQLNMLNFTPEVLLFIGSLSRPFQTVVGDYLEAHLRRCIRKQQTC